MLSFHWQPNQKGEEMKFNVHVMRIGYAFRIIQVEAKNPKEAEELALEEAGNHEYSEKSSEYSVQEVDEV